MASMVIFMLCFANYTLAGFSKHHSDCADPDDPVLEDGQRPGMEVHLHRDDYKGLALIPYHR